MELSYQEVYHMNPIEARKRVVDTYLQTGSIRHTAKVWNTSRQVVRKWRQRYQQQGEARLCDQSRRPHTCPRQTPAEVEQQVLHARERMGYGSRRLAWYLHRTEGRVVPAHTIVGSDGGCGFFLRVASGWQAYDHLCRAHGGKGMEGKTPYEKLREFGYAVPEEFALFPVVLLDTVSASWQLETGNDLLAHYVLRRWGKIFGVSQRARPLASGGGTTERDPTGTGW